VTASGTTGGDPNKISKSIVTAKGDLIAATGSAAPARLAVGSNGQALVADSAQSDGVKWATISGTGAVDSVNGQTGAVVLTAANVGAVAVALVDAKGDLLAATAPDTVARLAVGSNGQVLTADSAQAVGVKWAPATGGALKIATSGFVTSGNVTVTTSFTQIGPELTVAAVTGDILVVDIEVLLANSSPDVQFDASTRVSGADANWWSTGTSSSRNPGGVGSWYVQGARFDSPHGSARYTVQAGDIVAGNVTVRLQAFSTAATRDMNANASYPLRWWLTNLGAGS
jgi:hypothetical protein